MECSSQPLKRGGTSTKRRPIIIQATDYPIVVPGNLKWSYKNQLWTRLRTLTAQKDWYATETERRNHENINISSLSLGIDPGEIMLLRKIFHGERE